MTRYATWWRKIWVKPSLFLFSPSVYFFRSPPLPHPFLSFSLCSSFISLFLLLIAFLFSLSSCTILLSLSYFSFLFFFSSSFSPSFLFFCFLFLLGDGAIGPLNSTLGSYACDFEKRMRHLLHLFVVNLCVSYHSAICSCSHSAYYTTGHALIWHTTRQDRLSLGILHTIHALIWHTTYNTCSHSAHNTTVLTFIGGLLSIPVEFQELS
jgi:hypothetical protein